MLVISRMPGQAVLIGEEIRVDVLEVVGARARLRIEGPAEIMIRPAEPGDPASIPALVRDCGAGDRVAMGRVTIRVLHVGTGLVGLGVDAPQDLLISPLELRRRSRTRGPRIARNASASASIETEDDLDGQILPLWKFAGLRTGGDPAGEDPGPS
jgi:sRNA-binding carbon storage regulator CsrA